ncbi:MAG: hypothetical protein ACYDBB_27115 [Armatimonadota bacterium]
MSTCKTLLAAGVALACCAAGALAAPADPVARALVPANGKMSITEYGYRDWGPELVEYTVDATKFKANAVALVDGAGTAIPFQIDGNTLSFVASVARNQSVTYTLQPKGRTAPAATTLMAGMNDDGLSVENEFIQLNLPAPGEKTFNPPVDAGKATPPLLKWAAGDGNLMGGARFVTPRKVASQSFKIVRQGPAVIEYEARYTFEPKGDYVFRVRLSPGMPLALVTEEFDFNTMSNGEDMLVLDLHRGWNPAKVGMQTGGGEQINPSLRTVDYAGFVGGLKPYVAATGKPGEAPQLIAPEPGLALASRMTPSGQWGGLWGMAQVFDGDLTQEAGRRMAFIPLHNGSWRRGMAIGVWYKQGVGLELSLPISVRYSRWTLETSDDHSPFSSHEHDPELKPTYGRREWGLYTGNKAEVAQAIFGHIGLNRYKDWILDYPEDAAAQKAYPGGLFNAELLKHLRASIDQHPLAAELKTRYLVSGKPEDAVKNAEEVIGRLKAPYQENDFFIAGLSNYRKAQLLIFANRAEDALACPELPKELRKELLRRLAIYAYVMSEPDLNPRGNGLHLGNNNMPQNRTLALTYFAAQLPDHPLFKYWMDQVRDFARFKLATQYAVDGANIECPTYQLYAPTPGINMALNALRNRGYETKDLAPNYKGNMIFLANLSMPDPRFGSRITPGMGNSGNEREDIFGCSVGTFAESDPQFSGWLKYMFRLAGQKFSPESTGVTFSGHPMYYQPDVPEVQKPLATAFIPTYGVVFRHQFNTPNETAMLLRAGINWGHWDTDALNVILYGKGAPLSPGTTYQYYAGKASEKNNIYHNQLKIGPRDTHECFGRVDDNVRDYGFGPNADYAVASRFYPSQIFKDGKGASNWNRHTMFLKTTQPDGPSYFVMRDTVTGETSRPTYWTWMNLDGPENISVDGTAFDPAKTPFEKIVPEAEFQVLHGQVVETKTKYGASTLFFFSQPRDVRSRMVMQERYKGENKTIFEIPGAPGQDYLYVAFPRKNGEAAPACTSLGPGAMRVQTAESTDTVFIGDAPFTWNKDGIVFTGKAGAVRVFADRVALCLNTGSGRIGYKGYIIEGNGPFEQTVKLADLKPGIHPITGGYEKKLQSVDLGNNMSVVGEGPFTAKVDGNTIRITTDGRARVLHVVNANPSIITRPRYTIDGKEWMACWTDYPDNGWGSFDQTWKIGLSIPDGKHDIVLDDQVFPKVWARQFTPLIDGVVIAK